MKTKEIFIILAIIAGYFFITSIKNIPALTQIQYLIENNVLLFIIIGALIAYWIAKQK